ncbi:MAG: hypothetical protein GF320_00940, partial [Armatimonadia bacterium]|nr:hypothetical protein [Armatimonadia bacterium]
MHPALIVGIAFAVVAIVLIIARVLKGRQLEPGSIEETRPEEELVPEAELEEAKGLIEE